VQVLVDTSAWIAYFSGKATLRADWLDRALGRDPIVTADLVVGELLRGLAGEQEHEEARRALLRFRVYTLGGIELTLRCAEHQRRLRAAGAPVPGQVDCLIATFCLETGIALLHDDPAFEPFERHLGLVVPSLG
jgi:predicted nucleic acid-binding protein